MDKKRQIVFNLNNFLLAFSKAFNTKKATFIALNIAKELNFSNEKLADICSFNLAYPLGVKALENFDFLDKANLNDELFLEISNISQKLAYNFDFSIFKKDLEDKIKDFIEKESLKEEFKTILITLFSKKLFYLELLYDETITLFIYKNLDDFTKALEFEKILQMTNEFNLYIEKESKIVQRAEVLADFFEFEHKDKEIFKIACSLINIGKLFIKNTKQNEDERRDLGMFYSYHTKIILDDILGFSDISNLASKSQERLDGSGVFALSSKDLSFKDRLIICLNLYSYFKEPKPYKKEYTHEQTIEAIRKMVDSGKIDESLVEIFSKVFEEDIK
ncbi:phosphohydrolase [Aliarcobacter trophiarum LMG 25534]|uniref:C-di-GMP phosphodiesterase, class II (HD-GYP domain) n=1 Tax=Aliarcobacter trophiarum LMG 25534 TaxID=1032241 RepID=A0AAD0QJU4_9BACT|nr:HD domain-containing phosphohydrolase [Aliarcobacter trophiarum]AXK49000.1 c-di-GMP phosphodiesterase, class II (HD-GYP domain) [Aliarcobacter trophiarum LMG 25534]RXI24821.1 phosphohydrolase [Aliarcobacter trophiarum]RXJ92730.1 phosphohydrolase [Aliarcobacter trophiarum LMG 25534]